MSDMGDTRTGAAPNAAPAPYYAQPVSSRQTSSGSGCGLAAGLGCLLLMLAALFVLVVLLFWASFPWLYTHVYNPCGIAVHRLFEPPRCGKPKPTSCTTSTPTPTIVNNFNPTIIFRNVGSNNGHNGNGNGNRGGSCSTTKTRRTGGGGSSSSKRSTRKRLRKRTHHRVPIAKYCTNGSTATGNTVGQVGTKANISTQTGGDVAK